MRDWQYSLSVATGILIAESLRDDARLQGSWQLTRIERVTPTNSSEERRAGGVPPAWTVLRVELTDAKAQALAQALPDALLRPGWYAEVNTETETFAVFAGRVFRYRSDDDKARTEAAHGIAHGVPHEQLVA